MAETTRDTPVSDLLKGALDDVRELFREELALARAEVRAEMSKVTASAVRFGAGGAALWFAGIFLFATLALAISAFLEWPAWAGFGIVTLLLAIAGIILVLAGRSSIRNVKPMPRTMHTVKENFR